MNLYSQKILDFCKTQDLLIVNGRIDKDKNIGEYTNRNCSVVDYCLASPSLFTQFDRFEVQEFNPVISDVHCTINFGIETKSLLREKASTLGIILFIYYMNKSPHRTPRRYNAGKMRRCGLLFSAYMYM